MRAILVLAMFGLTVRQTAPPPLADSYGSAEGVVLRSDLLTGLAEARVTLWEVTPGFETSDFEYLLHYEDRGTPVMIREGEQIDTVVNVIPRGQ